MTVLAEIGCIGMAARFTLRNAAVVTADTCANYLVMIQWSYKWQPAGRWYPMAGVTDIRCCRMITRFTLGNATIMATDTRTHHFIMI